MNSAIMANRVFGEPPEPEVNYAQPFVVRVCVKCGRDFDVNPESSQRRCPACRPSGKRKPPRPVLPAMNTDWAEPWHFESPPLVVTAGLATATATAHPVQDKRARARERDRERGRERATRWYYEHRDEALARVKLRQDKLRDEINEGVRQYRQDHPDEVRARDRQYRRANRDRINANRRTRDRLRRDTGL
jgi:hypothetical protein